MDCHLAAYNHREAMSIMAGISDIDDSDEMLDINVLGDEFSEMTKVIMEASPRLSVRESRKLALRMIALFAA